MLLKHEFIWSKDSAAFPCYRAMSFAKAGNSLYVVGGVRCYLCSVLQQPLHQTYSGIIYDPSVDERTPLETPPFLRRGSRCFTRRYYGSYSYVVIGNKLCVSTVDFSCAYDIENKRWEACELFVDFEFESFRLVISPDDIHNLPPTEGCGPPFPFVGRAIFYESNILLCIIPFLDPQVAAIQMDGEKAVRMLPFLDCMPPGDVDSLIDLGSGYFSTMLLTDEWEKCGDLTFFTFKLLRSGRDGAVSCGPVTTSTWKVEKHGRLQRRPNPISVYSITL